MFISGKVNKSAIPDHVAEDNLISSLDRTRQKSRTANKTKKKKKVNKGLEAICEPGGHTLNGNDSNHFLLQIYGSIIQDRHQC